MWKRALALGVVLVYAPACKGGSSEAKEHRAGSANNALVEEALAKIVATCADADGVVETRRKGQPQWEPVAVGAAFRERDWVRTGAGGFARVRFSAGGFLELREHTTILVDSTISIDSGSLVAVAEPGADPLVVKSSDGSEARIVAAAGAGAAEFRLTPSSAKGLEIAVTKGSVKVTTQEGERTIEAGQASDLAKGATGEVVKLLGFPKSLAPGVDARLLFAPAVQIELAWTPVPEAARYRIQVARDTEFRALVLDADSTGPSMTFAPDKVGVYAWRAAGVDATGRLGEFGFARRVYFEQQQPRDLLVAPADGAKIGFSDEYPRIAFSWQAAGDATAYKFVIGRGADPTVDTVASVPTTGQQVELGSLREGTYRWGVYAVSGTRESPIFLAPRALTIRRQRVKANTDKLWDETTH